MASSPEAVDPCVRVLVVDGDAATRRAVEEVFRPTEVEVHVAVDGRTALQALADRDQPPFDVIVCELHPAGAEGLEILQAALECEPQCRVVLTAVGADIETAVAAMRLGAFDFVQKPIDRDDLVRRIRRAVEGDERPKPGASAVDALADHSEVESELLVAESASMREAVDLAHRVSRLRSTVLIAGETGTGKEVVAGFIHRSSLRSAEPFVKVNCAALPETLLESELFGHERGAFTGAERRRRGRFEQASGGTLLLDEIAETTSSTQAKLLRVLQDQEFHRVGGTKALRTDARILAASNCDLRRAVGEGRFREDLYHRLNVIEIRLPPLRERPEDAQTLARVYLEHFAAEQEREVMGISDAAIERIVSHPWPGNVRQLRNTIERAVLLAAGPRIEVADLRLDEDAIAAKGASPNDARTRGLNLAEAERELVVQALQRTGFVQKDAADLLGVSRRKLNYMIQRMGLTHPSWRRNRTQGSEVGADE